jgi:hypothetical protein
MAQDIIIGVDGDLNFPPEIRLQLARSQEFKDQFVTRGNYVVGGITSPIIEYTGNSGSAATLHLSTGAGFSAPYLMGIGNDHGNKPGLLIANKAQGIGLYIDNHPGALGQGIFGAQRSADAGLADFVASVTSSQPLVLIRLNNGVSPANAQPLLSVRDVDGQSFKIRADRGIEAYRNFTLLPEDGAAQGVEIIITDSPNKTPQTRSGVFITKSGIVSKAAANSSTEWFATRLFASGEILSLDAGGPAPFTSTAPSWSRIIAITSNSRLGFFGKTPVVKPTGVTADATSILAALVALGLVN